MVLRFCFVAVFRFFDWCLGANGDWFLVLAPSEHYWFCMQILLQLRAKKNCLWPSFWLWRWVFDPVSILCKEFGLMFNGEPVSFYREYLEKNPCLLPMTVCDPDERRFQQRLKGSKAGNRQPVQVPTPQPETAAGPGMKNSPRKRDQEEMSKVKTDQKKKEVVSTPPVMVRVGYAKLVF